MTEPPNLALNLSNVSKAFDGLRALDGVSLAVTAGERRAIIGPNGAGKTTLFGLISGETRATEGRITLFGRDVTRLPPHRRAALGLARTYQITNLFPRLTALGELSPRGSGADLRQASPSSRFLQLHRPSHPGALCPGSRWARGKGGRGGSEPLSRRTAPARDSAGAGRGAEATPFG